MSALREESSNMRSHSMQLLVVVRIVYGLVAALCLLALAGAMAGNKTAVGAPPGDEAIAADVVESAGKGPPRLPEPKGAKRLDPKLDVWVDPKEGTVITDGQVSLREGMLEMFACTRNTKEHESIVSANTKAQLVHAGLIAVGAEPGKPVRFVPEYEPPTGDEIEVQVYWVDENGKEHTARAQDWIKDVHTGKPMAHPFVFAGSMFWKDPETGKEYYQAEGGDFICVSNFGTAMLDIPVKSSQSNQELLFEARTEKIPPLGAPVRLILKPKKNQGGAAATNAQGKAQSK
jgi:hypothetical protein